MLGNISMETKELFREDGYLKSCQAVVIDVDSHNVIVDQTVFYPEGGGQPGDTGVLIRENGEELSIRDTQKDEAKGEHYHVITDAAALPNIGESILLKIDWPRRHRLMRMHSCLHMLCGIVPAAVTGGSIQDGRGRLDFDLPEPIDKEAIASDLQVMIDSDRPMTLSWISDDELAMQPDLVRTMSVKPPTGVGSIRLVRFDGIDLQPCGGTHVKSTKEIGLVRIRKIEKKGKRNRRIIVELADE